MVVSVVVEFVHAPDSGSSQKKTSGPRTSRAHSEEGSLSSAVLMWAHYSVLKMAGASFRDFVLSG